MNEIKKTWEWNCFRREADVVYKFPMQITLGAHAEIYNYSSQVQSAIGLLSSCGVEIFARKQNFVYSKSEGYYISTREKTSIAIPQ